ncbi:hypothetical protein SAMN00768000_0098 [Sulfobacillus thermosulfidooxidans DSM 9293]|uniref:Uncharacterized protein n=1 Tax=Sulfobacillus thermosulfidooxidans (strain DSM 9293 / VKM B-1269 / AT-1) TaxID=929705 RepID=A0A1W1W6A5_SULTA|nr:hypothetical protein SAMN00768000_0098 [Sulfobacillus thermosulfidooxidans DSM 9293]
MGKVIVFPTTTHSAPIRIGHHVFRIRKNSPLDHLYTRALPLIKKLQAMALQ